MEKRAKSGEEEAKMLEDQAVAGGQGNGHGHGGWGGWASGGGGWS